jgi:hypothetical protein
MQSRLAGRFAKSAALLSVVGFIGWLALSHPNRPSAPTPELAEAAEPTPPPPPAGGGSAVPCAVPLHWRLANVDPRFTIEPEAAADVVRRAAAAWERAAGRPIFVEDSVRGLPIRLVYDERQQGSTDRARLEDALAQVDDSLRAKARELDGRRAAYEQRHASYERDAQAFQQAAAAHADSVRGYNFGANGVPADLRAAQQRLDRRQGELLAVNADLEEQRLALRDDAAALNQRIDEHRAKVAELVKKLGPNQVESGTYREALTQQDGRYVALGRAIDVYEFDGTDELWLVLAHELGHAVGLGHAPGAGAVMSEAHVRTRAIVREIQPADLKLLRERCPEL